MKKIIFGITGLTFGGAERVLVDIVNKLVSKYDITIFTIYAKGELEKELSKKVKLKTLCSEKYNNLSFIKKKIMPIYVLFFKEHIYKKYIKGDYDLEIAFLEGPITRLFTGKNNKTKKIVWVHNDISKVFGNGLKSKIKKILDKRIYSKYKKIILVSKENLKNFNEVYKIDVPKEVIYNYIDKEKVISKSKEKIDDDILENMKNNENLNFLTVSRLVSQKAIDRLIKIHAKLISEGYYHKFFIIGIGPEKDKLSKLIYDLNVSDTFKLLGLKNNPYPYIKNTDYFCLLSYFEGYGMVLEEAKILNKNVIITNTAAVEAVENYDKSLILKNDEDSIYNGLKKVIIEGKKINNNSNKFFYDNHHLLNEIESLIDNI